MRILICLLLTCSAPLLTGCKKGKPTAPAADLPANSEKPSAPKSNRTAREEKAGFSLNDYKGAQPVLMLFADSPDNPSYKKFNAALSPDEIKRHDLVVIDVFDIKRGEARGQIRGGRSLHVVSVTDLVDAYAVGGGTFFVALRDKDGETVAHHKSYVAPSEVLAKLPAK